MNAYHAVFGKEEQGIISALRIGFMVNYLMAKYPDEWKAYCVKHDHPEIAYLMAGA